MAVKFKEKCKKCFHFQVCASVLQNDLFIREVMLGEKEPECKQFVEVPDKELLKAINLLIKQYEHSKNSDYVHHPVAHAFFHTWKQLDGRRE